MERNQPHSSEPSDKDAIEAQGAVFVQLLLEHEPSVRAFLRGLLPTWNDVDEVIQEASLVAWKKFTTFEQGTAFGGWFLTIARYEALSHRRQISKTPLVFTDDLWALLADESAEQATDDMSPQTYRQHLETCLAQLRPDQRLLLLNTHSPGVVIREIAKQSGKTEQAFYKVIQRLRATLLKCISRTIEAESM